jgi:hypothetical protein
MPLNDIVLSFLLLKQLRLYWKTKTKNNDIGKNRTIRGFRHTDESPKAWICSLIMCFGKKFEFERNVKIKWQPLTVLSKFQIKWKWRNQMLLKKILKYWLSWLVQKHFYLIKVFHVSFLHLFLWLKNEKEAEITYVKNSIIYSFQKTIVLIISLLRMAR